MGLIMRDVEKRLPKIQVFVRLCTALILVCTALIIGFDSQNKDLGYFEKKVTFRDLKALENALYIDIAAAAYNLLQLIYILFRRKPKGVNSIFLLWLCYFFDQIEVYVVLAGNMAATEHSFMVLTGSKELQWTKWCNRYTKFCFQIGFAIICCFFATLLMALSSTISAFNLFTLYSPKSFLLLKHSS